MKPVVAMAAFGVAALIAGVRWSSWPLLASGVLAAAVASYHLTSRP
jgi:hypothetical protein